MIKQAVGAHATQVAGVVYAFVAGVWISEKNLSGEIRPPPITRRNIAALHEYFPTAVGRYLTALVIKQRNIRIVDCIPHRHRDFLESALHVEEHSSQGACL